MSTGASAAGARYVLYLPRLIATWDRRERHRTVDATVVFADVSGFTPLTERLSQAGKVGAEQLTEIINGAFTEMLSVARLEDGDLVSFGGDAQLLLFTGDEHARRALTAAHEMQAALDTFQREHSPVPLAMSVGVATGPVTMTIVGRTQREVLLIGPTMDLMAALEGVAEAGDVLASPATYELVEAACRGDAKGPGFLLAEPPEPADADDDDWEDDDDWVDDDDGWDDDGGSTSTDTTQGSSSAAVGFSGDELAAFVPALLRPELLLTGAEGEHRRCVTAFLRAQGVTELLERDGADVVVEALDRLVEHAAIAAADLGVTLLSSDVDKGGAKFILTAGVPGAVPDAEERILRVARRIVDLDTPLRLHMGVTVGDVFSGDLGATFRRGYTVMGDAVNLAARLAGTAQVGQVITLAEVVEASRTVFDTVELPSVSLKGKSLPVTPISVGRVLGTGSAGGTDEVPLIGREQELQILDQVHQALTSGGRALVDVVGPIGIGKSRLLASLRQHEDVRVLIGECEQYEQDTSFHVVRILLRHLLGLVALDEAEQTEVLQAEVERLAPDLLPWLPLIGLVVEVSVPMTPEVEALDAAFRGDRLAETIAALFTALLTGPSVIGVDNAQWIDGASRDLFRALVPLVEDRPWALVTARRDESAALLDIGSSDQGASDQGASGEPGEAAADTAGDAPVRLRPGPLTKAAAKALVHAVTGDDPPPPHVVDGIVVRAEGNPMYVIELALTRDGDALSSSLERVIAARIDALAAGDRRLLRFASVLGQQFELELFIEVLVAMGTGGDDPEALGRLGEFVELSSTGKVRFRQALVRDVAYAGLAFARRQEIHGLVAETIERRARHRAVRQAAVLSTHFEQAGRPAETWRYAVAAGERAASRYAPRDAVVLFERALRAAAELPDLEPAEVGRVAEQLGDAARLIGDLVRADTAYVQAVEHSAPARRSALARKRGMLCEARGDYDDAIAHLDDALEPVDGAPLDDLVEAMVSMAGIRYRQGRSAEAVDWCRRALARDPERAAPAAAAHALQLLAISSPDPQEQQAAGAEAYGLYRGLDDHAGMAKVLNNQAIVAYYQAQWDDSVDLYRRAHDEAATAGDVILAAMVDNNLAEILSDQGHLDEAEVAFREAQQVWRSARYRVGVALVRSNLGRLATRRGDAGAALELLDGAIAELTAMGADELRLEAELRRVEAMLVAGELVEAETRCRELGQRLGADGDVGVLGVFAERLLGHLASLQGRGVEAVERLRDAVERGRQLGAGYEVALARAALAELGEGDPAVAEEVLAALGAGDAVRLPLQS